MSSPDIYDVIESANRLLSSIYEDFENSAERSSRRENSSMLNASTPFSPEVQQQLDSIDREIQSVPEVTSESNLEDETVVQGEGGNIVQPSSRRRTRLHTIVAGANETVQTSRRRNISRSAVVGVNETVGTSSRRRNQQPPTVEIINETLPTVTLPLNRNNQEPRTIDIIDLCSDSPEVSNGRRRRLPRQTGTPELVNLISPGQTPPTSRTIRWRTGTRPRSPDGSPPNKNARSPELMCAICMENYSDRQPTVTKCGHVFCKSCIQQSMRDLGRKCPICRCIINSRSLIRLHF